MNFNNILVVFFVSIFITSCAHLSKEGSRVLLIENTTKTMPSNCKFMLSISENGFDNNLGLAHTEARFDLRNLAAKKGANVVQVTSESQLIFPRGWLISGDAYFCTANTSKASTVLTKKEKCKKKGGALNEGKCVIDI